MPTYTRLKQVETEGGGAYYEESYDDPEIRDGGIDTIGGVKGIYMGGKFNPLIDPPKETGISSFIESPLAVVLPALLAAGMIAAPAGLAAGAGGAAAAGGADAAAASAAWGDVMGLGAGGTAAGGITAGTAASAASSAWNLKDILGGAKDVASIVGAGTQLLAALQPSKPAQVPGGPTAISLTADTNSPKMPQVQPAVDPDLAAIKKKNSLLFGDETDLTKGKATVGSLGKVSLLGGSSKLGV